MLKKFVQQGRSERRTDAYPLRYVEGLNDARTPLADFFSILLGAPIELRNHLNDVGLLRFDQFWINRK
jgi:hypothetical protein